MQQQTGALQMAQEKVAQTGTFRRTFDQARQVGHNKTLFGTDAHHTQIGVQGGEGVVGNPWTGIRDGADEGRFACIGHAQQTNIGQNLQLQLDAAFFAGPAGCLLAGRAVDGAFEAHVAKTAVATFCDGDHLTVGQ